MLIPSTVVNETFEETPDETLVSVQTEGTVVEPEPTPSDLLDMYEQIAKSRPGTRDAEIFAKIREWTFGDSASPAHEAAGITEEELDAWQVRHRINLSSGHIRPAAIDIDRGHAWGHIRRSNHLNRIHAYMGPPSADEVAAVMTGFTWSPVL